MTLRKLKDPEWMKVFKPCHHPEHNPPTMIVLEPGVYEHTCPWCRGTVVFTVPPKADAVRKA